MQFFFIWMSFVFLVSVRCYNFHIDWALMMFEVVAFIWVTFEAYYSLSISTAAALYRCHLIFICEWWTFLWLMVLAISWSSFPWISEKLISICLTIIVKMHKSKIIPVAILIFVLYCLFNAVYPAAHVVETAKPDMCYYNVTWT